MSKGCRWGCGILLAITLSVVILGCWALDRFHNARFIQLVSVSSGKPLKTLWGPRGMVDVLIFSSDGRHLVSGEESGRIKLWRVADGRLVSKFAVSGKLRALSPDGRTIAVANKGSDISLWRLSDGKRTRTISTNGEVERVCFARDGRTVACLAYEGPSGPDTVVEILRLSDGVLLRRFHTPSTSQGQRLAYSPDGGFLALAPSASNKIELLNVTSGTLAWEIHTKEPLGVLGGVEFSPDGELLAYSESLKTGCAIRLVNTADARPVMSLRCEPNYARNILFSQDGKLMAYSGYFYLSIWRLQGGMKLNVPHISYFSCAALSQDGQLIAWSDVGPRP